MIFAILSSISKPNEEERKKRKTMDSTHEQQNLQSTKKMAAYKILKEVSKFFISYYALSTVFSNPYWFSFFLQSFISHISEFPAQLLSLVDDKNCVFLVCNLIVVILAKSSRRLTSPSQPSPEVVHINVPEIPLQYTLYVKRYESLQPLELASCDNKSTQLIKNVVEEEHVEENGSFAEEVEEEERAIEDEESGGAEDEESDESYVWLSEDELEEESIARISTEELNRRCEEFIRRTKEEIRIQAQQQLIMV